ncbi:MAG: NUDIX domain-containing protein [Planctomycetota bacterium]
MLLYRRGAAGIEVFLVHPGGPFWSGREIGAWSIPKGECDDNEDPRCAAEREFAEETGVRLTVPLEELTTVRQSRGKEVRCWIAEGDLDPERLRSNSFTMEWPPHSGRRQEFPEADRGAWFAVDAARSALVPGQRPLMDALCMRLQNGRGDPADAAAQGEEQHR